MMDIAEDGYWKSRSFGQRAMARRPTAAMALTRARKQAKLQARLAEEAASEEEEEEEMQVAGNGGIVTTMEEL